MGCQPVTIGLVVVLVALAGCAGDTATSPSWSTPTPATPTPEQTPTEKSAGESFPTPEVTTVSEDVLATTAAGLQPGANGTLEVHFINVGQSVSTLVVTPANETMLIDSGDWEDDGRYVLSYLKQHDVDRLDHFVLSHNDADHIGGNAAIIDYYETTADGIGTVYGPGIAASTRTYQQYVDAIETHDVTVAETRAGDRIGVAGVDVAVLGPSEPYLANETRNENSIVLKVSYGRTSFLFTGDAEDDQEAHLVREYGAALRSTVLIAGHHGSRTSSSEQFLDTVQPTAAIVSSGYDSRHGHPHERVLLRLASRSILSFWTGTHGDIVAVSNGSTMAVTAQQADPTAPLALRNGSAIDPATNGTVAPRSIIDVSEDPPRLVTDGGVTTPFDSPSGTASDLALTRINADAAGDDRENLTGEYLVFENRGDETLTLSGWTVQDEVAHTYTFPTGTTLAPGAEVTVRTGSGTGTASTVYWRSETPIWNNDGDTVYVRTENGELVVKEEYE